MGDRALVTFKYGENFSPTVYLHWHGSDVPEWLRKAGPKLRRSDLSYACARFIGYCHEHIPGELSLGVSEPPKNLAEAISPEFSHGDQGVFIVDMPTGEVRNYPEDGDQHEPFTIELYGG